MKNSRYRHLQHICMHAFCAVLMLFLIGSHKTYAKCSFAPSTYHQEASGWYYGDFSNKQFVTKALPFRILDETNNDMCGPSSQYAADSSHVYFRGVIIPDADAKTVVYAGGEYIKDKAHVYFRGKIIPSADAMSLTFISGDYAKDKTNVFLSGEAINGADAKSFAPLETAPPLATDTSHVFYGLQIAADADPKGKIEFISGDLFGAQSQIYWSDGTQFFYKSSVLPEAEKTSFKLLHREYRANDFSGAEDNEHYFFKEVSFRKSSCQHFGKYVLQCGKEMYETLPDLNENLTEAFPPNSSFRKLTQLDNASFHWVGNWVGHYSNGRFCWPSEAGTEIYQDNNGVYLAYNDRSSSGLQKFADIKAPHRFSTIDEDLEQMICKTTNYTHIE